MTEAQFLTWMLSGAGAILGVMLGIIGYLVVRGLDNFDKTVSGVRDDFREKCDEITDELRTISKRVTDNSEAVSGRLADIDRRVVRIETICEGCRDGSTH